MNKEIKEFCRSLGFDLVKIIPAEPLNNEAEHLRSWLKKGFEGNMKYMSENSGSRANPEKLLPGAKSIICLAMNYYQETPQAEGRGLVARYAWGKDYHKIIEKKLKKLRQFLIEKTGADKNNFKLYSDAGPVLERAYAVKAGLGFIGKNTALITKDFGSWVFLAELITTLELDCDTFESEFVGSCGTCEKCINACPAKAIVAPYIVDARKCISYQTIENKGDLTVNNGERIFGCDICQEVCPHNCRSKITKIPEFINHISGPLLNPDEINKMSEAEFEEKFKGSPLKRAGLKGLRRNIQNML